MFHFATMQESMMVSFERALCDAVEQERTLSNVECFCIKVGVQSFQALSPFLVRKHGTSGCTNFEAIFEASRVSSNQGSLNGWSTMIADVSSCVMEENSIHIFGEPFIGCQFLHIRLHLAFS